MAYRKHMKSSSLYFKNYEILEENRILDTYIQYLAYLKPDKASQFFITRETVEKSAESIARIEALLKSKELRLVSCCDIFLEQVNSMMLVFTITPALAYSHQSLSSLLIADSLSQSQKLRIFQNLTNIVVSLHDLGVPHLGLCPDSILIENKSLVHLKPFKISPDIYAEDFYYAAPEVLSGVSYFITQTGGDIWSLGCIYAELFISLTPLFQAPTPQEKILRMFEVLGIPGFQEIEDYMTWENYKELKMLAKQNSEIEESSVFSGLEEKEQGLVLAMLNFAVDKRISAGTISNFSWNSEGFFENLSEDINSLTPEPNLHSANVSSSKLAVKDTTFHSHQKSDPVKSPFPELRTDNTLTVSIISGINLDLFRYCQDDYYLSFSFDLDLGGNICQSTTGPLKASGSLPINFTKEFPINSEDFKKKYRTNPVVIKVSQSLISGNESNKRRREDGLGVCEAYFGLLFSAANSAGNCDNSVQGWYHITSGKGVIGQLLIEFKTKTPVSQGETGKRSLGFVDGPRPERSLINEINQDMGNLTAQLKEKNQGNARREQE